MADYYGDIRPRKVDEFAPVIPTGSLRDYATVGPPMGAYGTLGTGLVGSLAAAATDNRPIIASAPRTGEEEEGDGGQQKKQKEEINLKTAGGPKNPVVTTTSPQAGDYGEAGI